MFSAGELIALVTEAAQEMGLQVGSPDTGTGSRWGVEVLQSGWERSNHYVELKRWEIQS